MRRAGHLRSLGAELAATVGTSWAIGCLLALGAVQSVYKLTDTSPDYPPPPDFPSVTAPLVTTAVCAFLVTAIAVVLLQRLSEKSTPAELLRA